jgi:hypothetical protein
MTKDIAICHQRLVWTKQTLQKAEGHATPQGISRESKSPKVFLSYFLAMSHIIDSEPYCHGEVIGE